MDYAPETTVEHADVGAATAETVTLTTGAKDKDQVEQVLVAVHGIGDQFSYATVQAVANQLCGLYDKPAAVPLGSFHRAPPASAAASESELELSVGPLPPPFSDEEPFCRLAFAEVYWAPVPRELVERKYELEEAKDWAQTIVARLRLRWSEHQPGVCRRQDFTLASQVLGEMIQTITVLDRLFLLASKAGVFTFNLKKLLEDYLGDVQVVTEFERQRTKILERFQKVMERVHAEYPRADIFIVSHSEGTVVSLLGLLKAFRAEPPAPWTSCLRGFMTLGSPIDKHLVLWPELFAGPGPSARLRLSAPIKWRNYYDRGDPVGFDLDEARTWLKRHGWDGVFEFSGAAGAGHDNGFSRYPFPGKAHVDYWKDSAVFGHFIHDVMGLRPLPKGDFTRPPQDKRWSQLLSYAIPYAGVLALLALAAYVLFKGVAGVIDPNGTTLDGIGVVAKQVTGSAALLFGVTVAARIPRLTREPFWRIASFVIVAVMIGLFLLIVGPRAGATTAWFAVAAVVVVFWLSAAFPSWGLKPLIVIGTLAALVRIVLIIRDNPPQGETGPLWPLVLALIACFYLWWLAALIFDLVFVWHLYIRHSKALRRMCEIARWPATRGEAARPAPARAS
jgi:hypothetical protein